jgi:hypothetical protein
VVASHSLGVSLYAGSDSDVVTLADQSFSENAALPHGSGTDRVLGESDYALFDCTASLHGYYSDVTRVLPRLPLEIDSIENS